jgi:hypothetical protein
MRLVSSITLSILILLAAISFSAAAPIQKVRGVVTGVGEGFLWLRPEGAAGARKFILRWQAEFVPPKLPLKGDRVLILYKDKQAGAVIYGVRYLPPA